MMVTAANVVLPQMKGALSATQDQIAWVVTFNLVAVAIGTPMTGWLAGKLGWRRLLVSSLIGFMISTLLVGLSGSLEMLVFFRVAQGLFSAPLMPLGQGMLLASFPRHQHALVMMLWGTGGVLGPILGPVIGGVLAELLGWRWAFFMVLPFIGLGLACALAAVGDQERGKAPKLDLTGFLSLSCAVGAAQLMLDRGQRLDWFNSPEIIIEAAVATIGIYVFVVHVATADEPFLSPKLLRDRNFALGLVTAFAMGWLSYTPIVLFPPLLQELRGYPDSVVGYLISARGLGNMLSFMVVVQFTRFNAKLALATGLVCQAAAAGSMAMLDINLTAFDVFWTNLLQGFGFGLAYTPMSVLAFSTLEHRMITEGSSVFNLMRNFGSSVFISLCVLVLVRGTATSYSDLSQMVTPYNELLRYPSVSGAWTMDGPSELAALSGEIYRQASMIGYIEAFQFLTVASVLIIPLAWGFKEAKPSS